MAGSYDMCVDYDTLCTIKDKLEKISYDLNNSTNKMVDAIRVSQNFLAGNQFEKAKRTTDSCVKITQRTKKNIKSAIEYIDKLISVLEDYSKLGYDGD